MIPINANFLYAVAPKQFGVRAASQAAIIGAIGPVLAETLDGYGINTRLRIAHFIGQTCHESDGFVTTEEYASGAAYEGRRDLGNDQPGDGIAYKGYGLIQTTGKANQFRVADHFGVPRENIQAWLKTPLGGLKSACLFWSDKGLNALADQDNGLAVTKRVNGGINGLKERMAYTAKAKAALVQIECGNVAHSPEIPVLCRGSTDEAVGALQANLQKHGYRIAIDRDFGAATEFAVMHFQKSRGLVADGIVGPATWKALRG